MIAFQARALQAVIRGPILLRWDLLGAFCLLLVDVESDFCRS